MTGQIPARLPVRISPFYIRMLVLAGALLAMLAAVAVLAHHTLAQGAVARGQVQQVHRVSVWLGHQIREAIHGLDTRMLRFKLGAGPEEWTRFQSELTDFRQWLEEQRSYLKSVNEQELFEELEHELARYHAASQLFARPPTNPPSDSDVAIEVAELSRRSKALIELGFELSSAHQATADEVLAGASRKNQETQWTTYAALASMLCVAVGMGWIVYRDSIAPMRRKLQESRRKLERHEKLAALGQMTAVVAHEIRNPLTAIKARLFTLRKLLKDNESAKDDARVISEEIDRLERIVHEFLQFARPPEPVMGRVDPTAILCRIRDLLGPQWRSHSITIELDDTQAPALDADGDQIEQALINLVQNAAQAIAESGIGSKVRLRAVTDRTSLVGREREAVRLEVADDGPGIPPSAQARLFDPFFTTKSKGTGLGLVQTARIVEKHGGHIEVSTRPGRGTKFALALPVKRP